MPSFAAKPLSKSPCTAPPPPWRSILLNPSFTNAASRKLACCAVLICPGRRRIARPQRKHPSPPPASSARATARRGQLARVEAHARCDVSRYHRSCTSGSTPALSSCPGRIPISDCLPCRTPRPAKPHPTVRHRQPPPSTHPALPPRLQRSLIPSQPCASRMSRAAHPSSSSQIKGCPSGVAAPRSDPSAGCRLLHLHRECPLSPSQSAHYASLPPQARYAAPHLGPTARAWSCSALASSEVRSLIVHVPRPNIFSPAAPMPPEPQTCALLTAAQCLPAPRILRHIRQARRLHRGELFHVDSEAQGL